LPQWCFFVFWGVLTRLDQGARPGINVGISEPPPGGWTGFSN
jgi:hypothetical protein